MKAMKVVLIILLIIAVLITAGYAWLGGFSKVKAAEEIQGGEMLVYQEVKGEYRNTAKVMDDIYYDLLNNEKIETFKGFGIYYDNPKETETTDLRSDAGCILEHEDAEKAEALKGRYNVKQYPEKKYITASFPYKSKMSVMMSIMKVYPALNKYCKEKGYDTNTPVMEIYDIPNKKIYYRKEIKN